MGDIEARLNEYFPAVEGLRTAPAPSGSLSCLGSKLSVAVTSFTLVI